MTALRTRARAPARPRGLAAAGRSRPPLGGLTGRTRLPDPGGLGDAHGGGALAAAACLLAVVALLCALWVLAPEPQHPEAPDPDLPGVSASMPTARAPHGSIDPRLGDTKAPSLGDGERSGQTGGAGLPSVVRHTELTHDHHYNFVWQFSLLIVALGAIAFAIVYPFARLPREGQRGFAALVASAILVMATVSFIAGVDPAGGPGAYEREPADVERSTTALGTPEITRSVHVHHEHPPIFLDLPLLLLGIGMVLLSVPTARIAARPKPNNDERSRRLLPDHLDAAVVRPSNSTRRR